MAEEDAELSRLLAGVTSGDRRALGRAITLVESDKPEDALLAEALLEAVLQRPSASVRVGITGPPGVGKSTLIDALGRSFIAQGERVAVLAIDPSSPVGGGSILGDKTRMGRLGAEAASFIRPSPSRGAQGGVGTQTAEAVLLCEAAGYSRIVIETLGTGQGEHAVAELSDVLVLVLMAGAGDEISGMKRGAIELADVVVLNKADGAGRPAAERAAAELTSALGLFARATAGPVRSVLAVSALEERGITELGSALDGAVAAAQASGRFARRRAAGRERSLATELERAWRAELDTPVLAAERARLEREVEARTLTPRAAARRLVEFGRGR